MVKYGAPNFQGFVFRQKRTGKLNARPVLQTQTTIRPAIKEALVQELLQSVSEMKSIRRGKATPTRTLTLDDLTDVARIRGQLGTLQNWEQGRRKPTRPAKFLLKVAAHHPKLLLETVR